MFKLFQLVGYQSVISNGDFEMVIGGMGNGDVYQVYNNLFFSEFYVLLGEVIVNNFECYCLDEVDVLLVEYCEIVDIDCQGEIVKELQCFVYDEMFVIGLYYGGIWGLFSDVKFIGWFSEEDLYMILQNYDFVLLGIFMWFECVKEDDK